MEERLGLSSRLAEKRILGAELWEIITLPFLASFRSQVWEGLLHLPGGCEEQEFEFWYGQYFGKSEDAFSAWRVSSVEGLSMWKCVPHQPKASWTLHSPFFFFYDHHMWSEKTFPDSLHFLPFHIPPHSLLDIRVRTAAKPWEGLWISRPSEGTRKQLGSSPGLAEPAHCSLSSVVSTCWYQDILSTLQGLCSLLVSS